MATEDDIIDYSAESVQEALQLAVAGASDPDSDRRADLVRGLRALPRAQAQAILMAEWGYTRDEISRAFGRRGKAYASRLVVLAFSNLKLAMNGRRLDVAFSFDGRTVQR